MLPTVVNLQVNWTFCNCALVGPTIIHADNLGAKQLAESRSFKGRSKHFEHRWRFLHNNINRGIVSINAIKRDLLSTHRSCESSARYAYSTKSSPCSPPPPGLTHPHWPFGLPVPFPPPLSLTRTSPLASPAPFPPPLPPPSSSNPLPSPIPLPLTSPANPPCTPPPSSAQRFS
jgi:hypothetical protein